MTYIFIIVTSLLILLSCTVSYFYIRKLKKILKEKDFKITNLEIAIGYAEMGLELTNEKNNIMKDEIKRLNSENKLLVAKLSKLNNQFKNVKDYLSKD